MKRILITGAASGLGLALAKKYASEGWSVCIADIQDEEGIKVAAHLTEEYATDCFFPHLAITSDTQCQELVVLISERWQGLDALIHHARVGASGDIDTLSIIAFQWTCVLHFLGSG